jgi:putative membrane protein
MWVIVLIVIAVAAWVIYRRSQSDTGVKWFQTEKDSPLGIAEKRYAKGEISKEEFENIKHSIS